MKRLWKIQSKGCGCDINEILSNDGYIILVSDVDYPFIKSLYRLDVDKHGYVQCRLRHKGRLGLETGSLHRVLMQPPEEGRKIVVDHINGNKLDNRRENLRIVTHQENMMNRKPQMIYSGKEVSSIYKGIYFSKRYEGWVVRISYKGKRISLGIFDYDLAAVNCYNYHAKLYHGDYAKMSDCVFMNKEEWIKYKRGTDETSPYTGVSYDRTNKVWIAQIYYNGHGEVIGRFKNEIDAASAYNKRSIEVNGDKAKVNIII